MENLEWFPVIGYEGLYEITKCGKVKSLDKIRIGIYNRNYKGKYISIVKIGEGYDSVTLFKNGTKKKWLLHRLIAFCFLDKVEGKEFVNHKDKNKSNNHIDNLEWVSSIENNCHMVKCDKYTSKYTGVYYHKSNNSWASSIRFNKKKYHLGCYRTEEDAYLARCKFEKDNNIINKYL